MDWWPLQDVFYLSLTAGTRCIPMMTLNICLQKMDGWMDGWMDKTSQVVEFNLLLPMKLALVRHCSYQTANALRSSWLLLKIPVDQLTSPSCLPPKPLHGSGLKEEKNKCEL